MRYTFNGINKNEIYILMCSEHENLVKKICCKIQGREKDIIITPGYNKTYKKEMYCKFQCEKNKNCDKKWNDSCFIDVDEKFLYGQVHTTRHNNKLHRTLYYDGAPVPKSNPMNSYCEYDRENIDRITDYELISGISFSSEIIGRHISKDYAKKNKYTIELAACANIYYDVYIFLNPKRNENLNKDLEKCDMDFAIMECETYEIVVGVCTRQGNLPAVIVDFTQMYIRLHPNEGVGNFQPLY